MKRSALLPPLLFSLVSAYNGHSQTGAAAVMYASPGSLYVQNFDSLPNNGSFSFTGKGPFPLPGGNRPASPLQGWQFQMIGGIGSNGSFAAGTGSATGSGVYSTGSAGQYDRALGSLASGSGIYAIGCIFTNTSGITLNSFTVSFTAEQWRKGGSANVNTWTFRYKAGIINSIDTDSLVLNTALNYTSVITTTGSAALNGNLSENQRVIHQTITGLNWKHGEQLVLRWDDADEPGSDDLVAIDQFSFTAINTGPPVTLPQVSTAGPANITTSSALLGGTIVEDGGDTLIEKGIVWSPAPNPTLSDNRIRINDSSYRFGQKADSLPQGSLLYFRAYAINSIGVAYGNVISFHTKTSVVSMIAVAANPGNSASASYTIKFAQAITGLNASHFNVFSEGISGAAITRVTGAGTTYTATLHTGSGDGSLQLAIINDSGLVPAVHFLPFRSPQVLQIDKSPPEIRRLSIPDQSMKIGDRVPVTIHVRPDTATHQFVTGHINGFPVTGFTPLNDSTYTAFISIKAGGNDIAALENIPTSLVLKDKVGNTNTPFSDSISQSNDRIDANKPMAADIAVPDAQLYKANDTLLFKVQFSEDVVVDTITGLPALSLTIGNRVRVAHYTGGNNSTVLRFQYVIQPGEKDTDGIRLNSPLLLNGSEITDLAGNAATLTLKKTGAFSGITIDAVAPVISSVTTPAPGTYPKESQLVFIVHFSKPVLIDTTLGVPSLLINIGNRLQHIPYHNGSGTPHIHFHYRVATGDLDKKGISLGAAIALNESILTDTAGNEAVLILKNTGALSQVKVDGLAPQFIKGPIARLNACVAGQPVPVGDLLAVIDEEVNEKISWHIQTAPRYGTLTGLPVTKISNGGVIIPTGISYVPDSLFTGDDLFTVIVTDGADTAVLSIQVSINLPVDNNRIGSPQWVCAGSTPGALRGSLPVKGIGYYTYRWESSTLSPTDGYMPAAGIHDQQDYIPQAAHTTTWYRRKIISGACSNTSEPVPINVRNQGIWLGKSDSSWETSNNWCGNLLPDSLTDVIITDAAKDYPILATTGTCLNLHLFSHTRLTIRGALSIKGNIFFDSTAKIDVREGSLEFSGTPSQTIPAGQFINNSIARLVIDNENGVTLNGRLGITNTLILRGGILATHDSLILEKDARIGPSAPGAHITGSISIEQALPYGHSSFRLLAHPFTNSIRLLSLQAHRSTGTISDSTYGITAPDSGLIHFDCYDEEPGYIAFNEPSAWLPVLTNREMGWNEWKQHQGIRLQMTGAWDSIPATGPITIRLSGHVNQGDQELLFPEKNYTGYRMATNPYPSPVDLSMVSKSSGIGNYYWVWNPHQGISGGYTSIPFKNRFMIPAFAAFFVKTTALTTNQLLFTENCKWVSTPIVNNPADIDDWYHLELKLEGGSIFWDRILLLHIDSARDKTDKMDAEKLMNNDVNFFSLSAGQDPLSIDARPMNQKTHIPLGLRTNMRGIFNIRVTARHLPEQLTLFLHDKLLDLWMPLERDSSYVFLVTADSATQGNNRFEITAVKAITADTIHIPSKIQVVLGPIPASDKINIRFSAENAGITFIRIIHMNGFTLKQFGLGFQREGIYSLPIADLPQGIYMIELVCGNHRVVRKMIRQ